MKHNLEKNLQIILNNYILFKCPIFVLYFEHITDIVVVNFKTLFFTSNNHIENTVPSIPPNLVTAKTYMSM